MKKRLLASLFLFLPFSLSPALVPRASAQPAEPPGERIGSAGGVIANGTPGGTVPADLALMLHAWDANGETLMLDGVADASGAFNFESVPMQDGWVFGVMTNHGAVTYFSEVAEVQPTTETLDLLLVIYETTDDASALRVSLLHTFLDFVAGELAVGEIYVLSNSGDRTVSGGVPLPDGRAATLQFSLPAGANKVGFQGNDSSARFVFTDDGFADLGAVTPGEATAKVLVSYTLPYPSGMTFTHELNYPVDESTVLIRAGSGVTPSGPGMGASTPRELTTGETFDVYPVASIASGGSVEISLTGQPNFRTLQATMGETSTGPSVPALDRWAIPIGAGAFGLAMISLGVWWLRRDRSGGEEGEEAAGADDDWVEALRAIAVLDDEYERGEWTEAEYRTRRAELRSHARALMLPSDEVT